MAIRVLVAEDHDLAREALCDALDAEPDLDVVACCRDGQEAVERLDHARPDVDVDVVVTDMAMPRLDGVGAIVHIRRHHPGLPVLVLTSAPHGERAAAALAAGAHIILPKTPDPSALFAAVRAARTTP